VSWAYLLMECDVTAAQSPTLSICDSGPSPGTNAVRSEECVFSLTRAHSGSWFGPMCVCHLECTWSLHVACGQWEGK
jgi:hypothetical protein